MKKMNKNKLQEIIREVIGKVLAEGPATAPNKPSTSPGPAVAPGPGRPLARGSGGGGRAEPGGWR